eukprot:TRINITY_DN18291_c0_g1_i2.p1 TRINITY_DN18291_c0_g1~~TRINITY_DN18291_c0_g1_i2.p1  ORF type:complete len:1273 (+),score=280.45 TRINITY_DN18291_c0_g1_i2:223-4041(+)
MAMASMMLASGEVFPSLQIKNIRSSTNPRLDDCSSGFDQNIVNFGFKLSKKHEGFFIIFANKSTRKNYLHNSKWLKSLKRLHISPGLDSIKVDLIEHSVHQGLIIPFLNLVIIPKDFYYHQDFIVQEEILLEYVSSTRPGDWKVALDLCHSWINQVSYSCLNNVKSVCNGHIGNVVLFQKLGKASGSLEKNIILCNLAFRNINLCRSMRSKIVLVGLLLNFPATTPSEIKRKSLQASQVVLEMCSSSLERLMTGKPNNKREFLANHTFNMACICFEMVEYDAAKEHIENIQILTEAESRKPTPDKHMMRIKEANDILSSQITDKLNNPAKGKVTPVPESNSRLENASSNSESSSSTGKNIIMIGEIAQISSDVDMKIDVFGRGLFNINVNDVEVFDTNGDIVNSLALIERTKHCTTLNFDQDLKVKQVFIQEKDQFENESLCSENEAGTKVNKVVTFNPKDDIFGESDEEEDSFQDDIHTNNILSSSISSNIVTAGDSEIDNILNDMEEYFLSQLEEKHKSQQISLLRKLANTMADSWRKNQVWLEEFWEAHICNSYDQSNGRFFQPRDVSLDQIRDEVTKNYNYNPSFNKRQFLNFSAEFLTQASIGYLKEKQQEREKAKDSDDGLTKSFKSFWAQQDIPDLSYDDIQEILYKNHVTIKFLKQGYECSLSNFDLFIKENLNKLEQSGTSFISVFKNFFKYEKDNKYIQPFTSSPKINNLNDSIVDIEDDDDNEGADDEESSTVPQRAFTETELKVQPYLTNLLEDITNNLNNYKNVEIETYHANIKEYLRRGNLLSEELKGTELLNEIQPVLDALQTTLSKQSDISTTEENQKTTQITSLPTKFHSGSEELPSCDKSSQNQPIETQNLHCTENGASEVLTDIYKLLDEMSEMIEDNVLVDIKEYERKVKALSIELKKTPQGTGVHFGVNIKQLHNKLSELKNNQSGKFSDSCTLESGMQQLDLKTDVNETLTSENQKLKKKVKKLEHEMESHTSTLDNFKSEITDQTLTISCLQTENFTLKLKEKDLQDTVNYIRKNQDSSLLKTLEKNKELESKNVELESENDSLKKKMAEMEFKMKEMEKEQILLEYKLDKTQNQTCPNEDIQNKNPLVNQEVDQTKPRIKLIVPYTGKFLYFTPDTKLGLPFLMVKKYHPETTAIKYKLAGGHWRMLILENDHFHPPEDGWGDREYEIVNQSKRTSPPTNLSEATRITVPRLPPAYPPQTEIPRLPTHVQFGRPTRPLMPHNPYALPSYPRYNPSLPPTYFGFGHYFK